MSTFPIASSRAPAFGPNGSTSISRCTELPVGNRPASTPTVRKAPSSLDAVMGRRFRICHALRPPHRAICSAFGETQDHARQAWTGRSRQRCKPLARNPSYLLRRGGTLANVCSLKKFGVQLLGSGRPEIGAHGNPVLFAHPSDLSGFLSEFEEVPTAKPRP